MHLVSKMPSVFKDMVLGAIMNFEKFILIFRDLIDKFLYIFAISHLKSTQIIIPDPISDPWSGWLGAFVSAFVGSGLSAIVAFYIAKWVANHTISKTLKAERDKDFRAQKAENLSKLEKVALKIFYRGYIYFNSELYGQIKDIVTFSKDSSEIFSFIFQLTRMQGVKNDAFLEAIMEWSILKEQLKTDDSIFWNSAIN
jgi:hypothetical protein